MRAVASIFVLIVFLVAGFDLTSSVSARYEKAATNHNLYFPLVFNQYVPPTPTPTFTPTPTPTPCSNREQAITNPSFEQPLSVGWLISCLPGFCSPGPQRSTYVTHSGSYSLLLGGLTTTFDIVWQKVTVPSWAESAAVYFNYWFETTGIGFGNDLLVEVDDETISSITYVRVHDYENEPRVWHTVRLPIDNITDYRGQSIWIGIHGGTGSSKITWWYVDDVELVFTCGNVVAQPDSVRPSK